MYLHSHTHTCVSNMCLPFCLPVQQSSKVLRTYRVTNKEAYPIGFSTSLSTALSYLQYFCASFSHAHTQHHSCALYCSKVVRYIRYGVTCTTSRCKVTYSHTHSSAIAVTHRYPHEHFYSFSTVVICHSRESPSELRSIYI